MAFLNPNQKWSQRASSAGGGQRLQSASALAPALLWPLSARMGLEPWLEHLGRSRPNPCWCFGSLQCRLMHCQSLPVLLSGVLDWCFPYVVSVFEDGVLFKRGGVSCVWYGSLFCRFTWPVDLCVFWCCCFVLSNCKWSFACVADVVHHADFGCGI